MDQMLRLVPSRDRLQPWYAQESGRSTLSPRLVAAVNMDCSVTENTETYPRTPQTGLDHECPRDNDCRWMYVQGWPLKVAQHPVPGLHASPDHEYPKPSHQSGDQACHDRVAPSALQQNLRACLLAPAVLSGHGISFLKIGPDRKSQPHSLASPLACPGVKVFVTGSC